jgi:hypothetical protein
LFYDGSGLCLFYKRLDRGTFRVPSSPVPDATHIELSERELDDLLDAIAVEPEPSPRTRKRTRIH